MRAATIITGILLALAGIFCLANPGKAFASFAFILGLVMLISGVCSVASYVKNRGYFELSAWRLADGVISIILSIMLLCNLLVTEAVIVLFFGMWVLFAGMMRIMEGFAMKRAGFHGWYWPLIPGGLCVVLGVFMFLNPLAAGLTLVILLGSVFILQGVGAVAAGVLMGSNNRAV